jgi:hypothetical protein
MVVCEICKKEFKRISNTHLKQHNITCNEYMEMYPNAEMVDFDLRKQISLASLGKTYEQRYGIETAEKLREQRKADAKKQFSDIEQRRIRFNSNWKGFGDLSGDHWRRIQHGANSRNLELDITIEDAWNKYLQQNGRCAISGIDITLRGQEIGISSKAVHDKTTASLDRIDSNKGYTLDNIQWIHKDLNQMKSDRSMETLLYWITTIYEYKFGNS